MANVLAIKSTKSNRSEAAVRKYQNMSSHISRMYTFQGGLNPRGLLLAPAGIGSARRDGGDMGEYTSTGYGMS